MFLPESDVRKLDSFPGTWSISSEKDRNAGYTTVYFTCPKCRLVSTIMHTKGDGNDRHAYIIEVDGEVFPTFVCPYCSWHDFIKLEGWERYSLEQQADK